MKLEQEVIEWAEARGIIKNSNVASQTLKLVSEMGELADHVAKNQDIVDDIGDCLVVLIVISKMNGLSIDECLAHAYNDIKDRKGYLNESGVFIKE